MSSIDASVNEYVRRGWRVESRTDTQVVLVRGHRPNHILHLILSIITLGVWLIVWILVAVLGGEKRKVLTFAPETQKAAPEGAAIH